MTERYELYNGDCLDILPTLLDNSVDLIVTDPPYFKVKNLEWDRQWAKPADFLGWLDIVLGEFHRLLKPNGSLYLFASPQMGSRVELLIAARFNVLNHLVWLKTGGTRSNQADKDILRQYFGDSERIIFAEHYGADINAGEEAGYKRKCDEAARDVFGKYITSVRVKNGLTMKDLTAAVGAHGAVNHGGACSNWENGFNVPTLDHYNKLQTIFPGCFDREYEDLRREYEDLRRPFNVSPDVPYTDVWTFPTVQAYPGKHECEKPAAMIWHIVEASSRPGAVVLDAFAGSGVVGEVCGQTGRDVILIEKDRKWYKRSKQRTAAAYGNWDHAIQIHAPKMKVNKEKQTGQMALFGDG